MVELPCTSSEKSHPQSAAFRNLLVDGVARHNHPDFRVFVLDHRLASQARGGSQAGRPIQQVLLALFRFRQFVVSLLDDYMTGGAGAVAAAGMLQRDAVPEQDIEDRAGLPVMLKRRLGRAELDHPLGRPAFENHTQLRHYRSSAVNASPQHSKLQNPAYARGGGSETGVQSAVLPFAFF